MASVRITNDMRYHVQNKIDEMYQNRIAKLENEINAMPMGNETAMAHINPHELEIVQQLNSKRKWLHHATTIYVKARFRDSKGKQHDDVRAFALKPTFPIPVNMHGAHIDIRDSQPSYAKYIELLAQRMDTYNEQHALKSSISELMNHCTTLQQLLEAWPSALDYVQQQYRERFYSKTEKKEKKEAAVVDDETKLLLFKANLLKN